MTEKMLVTDHREDPAIMGAIERVTAQCDLAEKLGGTDQLTYAFVSDLRCIMDTLSKYRGVPINVQSSF